jgi:Mg2+/Co2+ transporter CorC
MKNFKEMIRDDVADIFLNPDEFGEPHMVNGRENVNIIFDDVEFLNREKFCKEVKDDGTSLAKTMFYVKASDFGRLPKTGTHVTIDSMNFRVEKAVNEQGLYSITIRAVTAR